MHATIAPPTGLPWPGPVVLDPADLSSRWGFDEGLLLEPHCAWYREQLGVPDDHPYVDARTLLRHVIHETFAEAGHTVIADQDEALGPNPVTASGSRPERPVVIEDAVRNALSDLYPPRRPCDYRLMTIAAPLGLRWSDLFPIAADTHPDIVNLAAENLEAHCGRRSQVDVNEAFELAALAYGD